MDKAVWEAEVVVIETFTKRQKKLKGEFSDVFVYTIPVPLRIQIAHIWGDIFGIVALRMVFCRPSCSRT